MARNRIGISVAIGFVLALTGATMATAQVNEPSTFAQCDGRWATIVSPNPVINGTPFDDVIVATGLGDNTIFAGDGNDLICAGPGNDVVYGGRGNDRAFGGTGNDYLFGETGSDVLYGGDGDDQIHGHDGNDIAYGENGRDRVVGWAGADWLSGGDQDDRVDAVYMDNFAPDTARGDGGVDTVITNDGVANDVNDGGATFLDTCLGEWAEKVNCP
ncbi:MAG: calcium-binding protein [Acidimicrobiales bacterium]